MKDLGEKNLKNVARPIRAYALTAAGAPGQPRSVRGLTAGVWKAMAKRHALAEGVGAILAALIAAIATSRRFVPGSAGLSVTKSPGVRSIAVLPLENLSGDPAHEYFANGMTDETDDRPCKD